MFNRLQTQIIKPQPVLSSDELAAIEKRRAAAPGTWDTMNSPALILRDGWPEGCGAGPYGSDHVVAAYSDDALGWLMARLVVDYHELSFEFQEPITDPDSLKRLFSFSRRLHAACQRGTLSVVREFKAGTPKPWVHVLSEREGDFQFLQHAIEDALKLTNERERELCLHYLTIDGGYLTIDAADEQLFAARLWHREPFSGRYWDGRQFLDEVLLPHDPLKHSVIHLNGIEFDFRRHNLELEDRSELREIDLKPEIWALVDQSGRTVEAIIAEHVGWRG